MPGERKRYHSTYIHVTHRYYSTGVSTVNNAYMKESGEILKTQKIKGIFSRFCATVWRGNKDVQYVGVQS